MNNNHSEDWPFDATPTDTALFTDSTTGPTTFDVTGDVAAFLSGTSNHGWIVKKENEGQSGKTDFESRENGANSGPRLILNIQPAGGGSGGPVEQRFFQKARMYDAASDTVSSPGAATTGSGRVAIVWRVFADACP